MRRFSLSGARMPSAVLSAVLALGLVVLAGCEEGPGSGPSAGFRKNYDAARGALEAGKYDRAARAYARLVPQAGPFAPRIRLEYAHALLRAGDHARAASEARALAQAQESPARLSALAVQGTAEHELGLKALDRGETETGRRLLQQADAAMEVVLAQAPDLDPLGALAARRASIAVRLKALG